MNDSDILILIANLQEYIMVLSCILCFIYFFKLDKTQQVISYYLFFLLIMNYVMRKLSFAGVNNLAITHILVLGEFVFLSFYFKGVLKNQVYFKKYFRLFLGVIGGLVITNTLFIEKINTFNTNAKVFVLLTIIFVSTLFFYDRAKRLMNIDAYEKANRIITSALLLYYSGSFFVYLFYKFTQNNEVFYSNKMLIFNAALYLLFTILMLMAILTVVFQGKEVVE